MPWKNAIETSSVSYVCSNNHYHDNEICRLIPRKPTKNSVIPEMWPTMRMYAVILALQFCFRLRDRMVGV